MKKEQVEFIKDVLEFHKTFNHPVLETPQVPSLERQQLRLSLLREEVEELYEASGKSDIVECADAFADIMYVLCGAILEYGLGDKFHAIFKEVQRSNMSKACATEKEAIETMQHYANEGQMSNCEYNEETKQYNVFRSSDKKLLKSINYSPANIEKVLNSVSYEVWNENLVKDVSIHFTIKGQTIQEVDKKFNNWIMCNSKNLPFDFSESTEPRTVLHHCFLPKKEVEEKGLSTEIYDIVLDPTAEQQVCWYNASEFGLVWSRRLMLENIAKLKGIALFIGEIKEGVLEEYNIAKELGINIIHIQ